MIRRHNVSSRVLPSGTCGDSMSARAVIAWLVIRAVLCQKMIPTDNHRSKPSATPCRAVCVDGISIAQTGAIARFCGKLGGLYPTDDHVKAARIDQFIDFATDLNILVSNTNIEKDENKKFKMHIRRFELDSTIRFKYRRYCYLARAWLAYFRDR
jgi:hypothetical protein